MPAVLPEEVEGFLAVVCAEKVGNDSAPSRNLGSPQGAQDPNVVHFVKTFHSLSLRARALGEPFISQWAAACFRLGFVVRNGIPQEIQRPAQRITRKNVS